MKFKTLALKTEGNIVDNRQVLKIWESYITELYTINLINQKN
jgi:hypothetical protein